MEKDISYGTMAKFGSGGFMNPDSIVKKLGIRDGMVVADFGCGAGYFTIPVARIIRNNGKIYAIDVLGNALETVASKAKLYGLLNVETVRANVEVVGGTKIKDDSVDVTILANILFQCKDHKSVLSEAKRITKSEGIIVIIDWIPQKISLGPKFENCLSQEDVKKICIKNNLKFVEKFNAGSHHYGMVFSPVK